MRSLTKGKQDKVRRFRGVTQASERNAIEYLKAANWSVDVAIDRFYATGGAAESDSDNRQANIEESFAKYKDESG